MTAKRIIPIFPLDLVLFPGQELPLRIFEPRYKQMVEDCIMGDGQFGVCLVKEGESILGWEMPHEVGTIAKIVKCGDVGIDGAQLSLETLGRNPFRILSIIEPSVAQPADYDPHSAADAHTLPASDNAKTSRSDEKMYIRAEVEVLPEIDGDIPLAAWEHLVFLWKSNVASNAKPDSVPSPVALDQVLRQYYLETDTPTAGYVYSLCALVSSGPADLQELLESESVDDMLRRAERLIRRGTTATAIGNNHI